jgi:hypothetical protein
LAFFKDVSSRDKASGRGISSRYMVRFTRYKGMYLRLG